MKNGIETLIRLLKREKTNLLSKNTLKQASRPSYVITFSHQLYKDVKPFSHTFTKRSHFDHISINNMSRQVEIIQYRRISNNSIDILTLRSDNNHVYKNKTSNKYQ